MVTHTACCIPVTNICFVSNRWRCCQYILATRMACFVHTVLLSAEKWSSGPVSLPAWSSYNANGRWRRIKLAWYCWCNKKNEKGAVAILAGVQRNCSGNLAYQLLNSRSSAAMRIYWFRSTAVCESEAVFCERCGSIFSVILPASSMRSRSASYIIVSMLFPNPAGRHVPSRSNCLVK